jgi:hypothetical protein
MPGRPTDLVVAGTKLSIAFARDAQGRMPAHAFIETEAPRADLGKLFHSFEVMAERGRIDNVERFRHERGAIFAFKSGQIRLACFRDGNTWYLTNGFVKKKSKWPRSELIRAERIRSEHLARKGT